MKCVGGFPCDHCTLTKRICSGRADSNGKRIPFIDHFNRRGKILARSSTPNPTSSIVNLQHRRSQYVAYFFSHFLARNSFSGKPGADFAVLSSLAQVSPSLHYAVLAVSALHISEPNTRLRTQTQRLRRCDALEAYEKSVNLLRSDLARLSLAHDDSALWTTFFLGVFEVSQLP